MLNPDVPFAKKIYAMVFGVLVTGVLVVLEVPLDLLMAAVPGVGLGLDFLVTGSEAIILPLLLACAVLPRLVAGDMD